MFDKYVVYLKKTNGHQGEKMAGKTNSERIKNNSVKIRDNAEKIQDNAEKIQDLENAIADILAAQQSEKKPATKKSAAKKPATKKPAAKSSAAKKPAAKKPAAKSSTTKKPAAKKPAVKKEPEPVEQTEEPVAEKEPVAESAPVVQEPVAEAAATEPTVTEPVEQQPETLPDQPVEPESAAEPAPASEPESIAETKAEEPAESKKEKRSAARDKAQGFLNKAKLPIFIIVNALLVVSSVLLLISAFDISYIADNKQKSVWFSLFGYFSKSSAVKGYLAGTALGWAGAAYAIIGILMVLAVLVPLALAIKNVILLAVKKDKEVHMLDAIVSFAFMLGYIAFVNLFGANVTAGHVIALIVSVALLAFTIFVALIMGNGKLPIFSIAGLALIFVSLFLLTATPIYLQPKVGGAYYGASAASAAGAAGGIMFVCLVVVVAALIVLTIMQLKKLPALVEIIVPAIGFVGALVALIVGLAGRPTGLTFGGGFMFGTIFAMLVAAADLLFTLVKPLKKLKVQVCDSSSDKQAVAEAGAVAQPAPVEAAPANEAAEPVQQKKVFCGSCGAENAVGDKFCLKCGSKLE